MPCISVVGGHIREAVEAVQRFAKKRAAQVGQLFKKFYKFPTDYSVMSAYMKYQYPLDACHAPVTLSLMR